MASLKPNAFAAKVLDRLARGRRSGDAETLTVQGRRTGKTQSIPVVPVDVDGTLYLVSARGETEWVRSARANPEVSLTNKGGTRSYRASELPVEERAPYLTAYRKKAGRTVEGYWRKLPDDKDHPVFRLT